MTQSLDVMMIESRRGVAAWAVHALEAEGHRIRRCHDEDSSGFPCRGVIDPADCPLAAHADIALLVRDRVAPHPTALEQGATCAIRAGVPLIEAGPITLDPYEARAAELWAAGASATAIRDLGVLYGLFGFDDVTFDRQARHRGRPPGRDDAGWRGFLELSHAELPGALADQPVQRLVPSAGGRYPPACGIPERRLHTD
jgi:hypothetical protein